MPSSLALLSLSAYEFCLSFWLATTEEMSGSLKRGSERLARSAPELPLWKSQSSRQKHQACQGLKGLGPSDSVTNRLASTRQDCKFRTKLPPVIPFGHSKFPSELDGSIRPNMEEIRTDPRGFSKDSGV